MNKLFANTNVNLKIAIESLTDDDMQIMYGVQTFYKGKSYYTQKLVASSNYSANLAKLTAIVRGSREYKVTLELDNENIIGECTCPVGDECKHQAAVLFYARSEKIDVEIERNERADHLTHAHLESLSKSELIKLVIQYAPSNFFIKIKNISSGKPEALTVFKKVKKVIEQLFDDPENLYEPYEAMDVIGKQLNKLSELESQLHPELESFIFFIMQKVNEAQDEGYLYDSYSDGPFESPEELDTLVKNYAASLPYEDKKLFLYKLDQALTKAEYDTFSHLNDLTQNLFTEADLPELKNMIMTELSNLSLPLIGKYYEQTKKLMTVDEKENVLLRLKHDSERFYELVVFYRDNNKSDKGIKILQQKLIDQTNKYNLGIDLLFLYLDLVKEQNGDLPVACREVIIHSPTSGVLKKIKTIIPDVQEYELELEKKNPSEMLNYLESTGRLKEALGLIKKYKIWDDQVTKFFSKHKADFKEEAENYFCKKINDNLKDAGDHFYETIANALKQIKQINIDLAVKLIKEIQINYKRRRNLMILIAKI